jgi:hypothetical protein
MHEGMIFHHARLFKTKLIAASQMASASAMSFFWRLT